MAAYNTASGLAHQEWKQRLLFFSPAGVQSAGATDRGVGGRQGAETRCLPVGSGGHVLAAVSKQTTDDAPARYISLSVFVFTVGVRFFSLCCF